jgi:hypothetical protein
MEFDDGIEMIQTCFNEDADELLYNRWLSENIHFEKPMGYDEYKKMFTNDNNNKINKKRTDKDKDEFDNLIYSIVQKDKNRL